jgi:glycosyltransferase involved in cell wall biosynthesis
VSESARALYLHRVGGDPARARVIYNGVDPARFAAPVDRAKVRRSFGLSEEDRAIVSLGRLRRQKGHDVALRAMTEIAAAEPRARMLVVGDGPERARLEKLHARLGLAGRAIMTGQREDVPGILAAADCLVAPSRYEGFGLAVAEAMAAGAPVVASRVDSIPEIVEDGVSGLLVRPGDARDLARGVVRVLGDAELARSLGERGRARVAERFTLDRMLRAYEELYENVLRAKGDAPR